MRNTPQTRDCYPPHLAAAALVPLLRLRRFRRRRRILFALYDYSDPDIHPHHWRLAQVRFALLLIHLRARRSATPFSSLFFEGRSYNVTWQRRYNLSDVVWPLSATCDGCETIDKDSRAWLCDDFLANHHVPLTAFCHKTVYSVDLGGFSAGSSETNIVAGSMPAPLREGDGFAKPGPYNFYLGMGYGESHTCREDGHGCDIKFDFPDVDLQV
ncbi:hypothetical protein JCM10296v2_007320 [Rhodotorula toruloides]